MSDEELGLDESLETTAPISDLFQKTLSRFNDHRVSSLEKENTLMATIGTVTADLLEVHALVAKAIRNELGSSPLAMEDIEKVSSSIDLQIRLSRQIAQLAQLEKGGAKGDAEWSAKKPR